MNSRGVERYGYHIVMAAEGAQGVVMPESEKLTLVLMDMGLPVTDRAAAIRALKADAATAASSVIGSTPHTMAEGQEECLEAWCDDCRRKPLYLPRRLDRITALHAKSANP